MGQMEETEINKWYFAGFYMVGEEDGNWHGCIAKTKHLAGSLEWSGLYGFWALVFFLFFIWIASCFLFHHIIQKRGWDGRRYHSYMSGHVLYWSLWCHSYNMSLFARGPSHRLDLFCLRLSTSGARVGGVSCACVLIKRYLCEGLLIGPRVGMQQIFRKALDTNGY